MSDGHEPRPAAARPLSNTERAVLDRLERDLDVAAARAERVAMRRLERDLAVDDPGFATMLRASADSPAMQSAASATVRAWIWFLSVFLAVGVGLAGTALIASTLGPPGLAVGAGALLVLFVGLVVTVRFS